MDRILFVEDDPVIGRGLSVNLELEGYQVTWVQNLGNARATKSGNKFSLIILDLGLPDGNGLDFLKDLRAQELKSPISPYWY